MEQQKDEMNARCKVINVAVPPPKKQAEEAGTQMVV
jgi:hypothetical protein